MRILFLTQHFMPHFEGGTESVVRAAAEALVAAGHELLVVAGRDIEGVPAGDPAEREERTVGSLRVVHLAPRAADAAQPLNDRLMLERPTLLAALLEEVRAFGPDLVHLHHQATLAMGLVPALEARGLPAVVSLHDLFATCPRFFRVPPAALVERLGLECPSRAEADGAPDLTPCIECIADEAVGVPRGVLADAFRSRRRNFALELDAARLLLAPSGSHARRLERELDRPSGSIGVVENGLVAGLPRLAAPPELQPGDALELVYLGHRARVKGLAELATAAAGAAAHSPRPLRLVCHGSGLEPDLEAELVALGEYGAPGFTIELRGPYERADLPRLCVGAHLAVFPSRAPESYGLVVDEALALGLPVLCAESGALAERLPTSNGGAGLSLPAPLPADRDGGASIARWAEELGRIAEVPGILAGWRAAIPDRIPGPDDLARRLVELYTPLLP